MKLVITFEREDDGRWIGIIDQLNVLVYGDTPEEAVRNAQLSALQTIAHLLEMGELRPLNDILFEFPDTIAA